MTRITRLIGLAAVLVLIFSATIALSMQWSKRQADQLKAEVTRARQVEFARVAALVEPGPLPWSNELRARLETALDVRIVQRPYALGEANLVGDAWSFMHQPSTAAEPSGWMVQVSFPPPPAAKLAALYRHLTVATLVLAQTLVLVLALALVITRRRRSTHAADSGDSTSPFLGRLSHLAKTSVQTTLELERERGERLRAEEDLHFQQVLLNRSLEEKIRLGHDLHDGIIQSLYATGLTLEAAKKLVSTNPVEAQRQLDVTLETLNRTIRDVRGYILGLAPDNLRQQSFAESVQSLAQTMDAGRGTSFDIRVDDAVAKRLSDQDLTDLLQIVREGVSNALRHGQAHHVVIRLQEDHGAVCLLVQDDGRGFDPERLDGRGHGLGNLQARAERLRGQLRCTTALGKGTRLTVTLPAVATVP